MTLFSASHATKVLALAVVIATSGMMAAQARDNRSETGWSGADINGRMITRRERHDRDWRPRDRRDREYRHVERHRDHRWRKDRNFYGGAITAYSDPGNGLYFYIDDDSAGGTIDAPLAKSRGPKIITVMPGQSGCSFEAGVCVVRPSR